MSYRITSSSEFLELVDRLLLRTDLPWGLVFVEALGNVRHDLLDRMTRADIDPSEATSALDESAREAIAFLRDCWNGLDD